LLCGCLQDGVVIGDNVNASHALLCEGVVVGAGATISPGVVLSYGLVVAPRHTVPAYAIVSLCKQLTTEVRGGGQPQQLGVAAAAFASSSGPQNQ
jgi:tetrahydrodipicolinate N-succinyltransferase